MNNRRKTLPIAMFTGFAISLLIAIFVSSGIPFVLYMLNLWQISTLNTIILYAMLFIVAKTGTQLQGRKPKLVRKPQKDPDKKSAAAKDSNSVSILTIIWSFLGIYAILWVTPALIMYWIYLPPYSPQKIMFFAYVLSVATAAIYLLANEDRFSTWRNKAGYFAGAGLGPVLLDYLF
jgi:hypothetical protein